MEADKAQRMNDQMTFNYHALEYQFSTKALQMLEEGELPEDGFGGVSVYADTTTATALQHATTGAANAANATNAAEPTTPTATSTATATTTAQQRKSRA
jgi:hypothetical protein